MSASFSLATSGGIEIQRRLGDLVQAFGGLRPLMESIGLTLESATIDRFDSETAPDGRRWKPSLRARTEGGKTLTERGLLRQSVHSVAGSDNVEVGTNLIYAGVHQTGATIRAKTEAGLRFQLPGGLGFRRVMEVEIPARPFLGLSRDDETEVLAQVDDYAAAAMGGSGGPGA